MDVEEMPINLKRRITFADCKSGRTRGNWPMCRLPDLENLMVGPLRGLLFCVGIALDYKKSSSIFN
jgi:hypothetical protein